MNRSSPTRDDSPPPAKRSRQASGWERLESKSKRGEFYYYNHQSGESRVDRPSGVEIQGDIPIKASSAGPDAAQQPDDKVWERIESKSKKGQYYYFNHRTRESEEQPPAVRPPWRLAESKSTPGQFFYFHEVTEQTLVDPPASATPAPASQAARPPAAKPRTTTTTTSTTTSRQVTKDALVPPPWAVRESSSFHGKFYCENTKTGETLWVLPDTKDWTRCESSSNPGRFYWFSATTGEKVWEVKAVKG